MPTIRGDQLFTEKAVRALNAGEATRIGRYLSIVTGPRSLTPRFEQLGVSSRQHPRVAATFPLTYTLAGDSVVSHGRTRDISGGGMSFDAQDMTLDQDALIAVAFEVRGIRIAARGRVVGHKQEAAKGARTFRIRFADISFETQTLLAVFVLRNSLDAIITKALSNVV